MYGLNIEYHPFSTTGQLTPPPEAAPLTPPTPPTLLTPPTPLVPQSNVGADSPRHSPSVEKLSFQHPTYQHPSRPPTNLERVQVQPQGIGEEIKQFEEKYRNLVHSVLVGFQQGSISLRDILACLMVLPISRQLQLGNLLQNKARQLSQASSIKELFLILSETPYWNFLNPSLLSHLVEEFGDGPTKQQKNKYLEELRGFRMRTKVKDFMGKWTGTSQSDTQELVLELEEVVWRKRTLEQLEQFRLGLSRKRSLEDSALPFKVPSINAVFSLPKSIAGHVLHLEVLREFFLAHQVLRVLLDGVCILDLRVCTLSVMPHVLG